MKLFIRVTAVLWCLSIVSPALAGGDIHISEVAMTSADSYVEFAFSGSTDLDANQLSARMEDTLIVLSVDDADVARTWIASTDKHVRRVLLHPLKNGAGAALRIRYFKSVSASMLANIRVRVEGKKLIAAIPNTPEVAAQWAAHAKAASAATGVKQPSKKVAAPANGEASSSGTKTSTNPEEEIAIAPDALEVPNEASDASDQKVFATDDKEAGVAATERSGTPLLVVAAFLMLGVGFVLFKKMRQMKPAAEGGPLIRPIGTHMLGPKQGLLLVDVAGEMVLLGTTDKGVQLLTKLDGDRIQDETTQRTVQAKAETAPEPTQNAENPFGKMLGQFREASARLRGTANTNRSSKGALDELALLAGDKTSYDRREFRPVTPKTPVPPYESQPSLQERDELIEKLRMLKGA